MTVNIDELSCDQIKALYRYIADNHLVINSGRRSGKSKTLHAVFQFWLEHEMKNGDTCVLIGHSRRANDLFIKDLFAKFACGYVEKIDSIEYKLHYSDKICYMRLYTSAMQYFLSLRNTWYGSRTDVTLILGDEKYISDDWCSHTACAFTQRRKFVNLMPKESDKEELRRVRNGVSSEFFDMEIGQYLPDGWLDE